MTAPMCITDLSHKQLRQVLAVNEPLREAVKVDSYIWQTVRIGEILAHFKDSLTDYAVSSYGANYVTINRNKIHSFIIGVRTADNTHDFLSEKDTAMLHQVEKDIELALDRVYANVDYTQLYASIHINLGRIAETISKHFESMLADSHTDEAVFAHLCDTYIPKSIPNAYINIDDDANSDYVLYPMTGRAQDQPNQEMSVSA